MNTQKGNAGVVVVRPDVSGSSSILPQQEAALLRLQAGQALPLGLVLMTFAIFMSMTLFNTGQLSAEKMRVTNAADAAAYSGLLWQARALNFQAYTNRAMVANQVSIAQAVSLRSWAQYGRISANNVNSVLGSLPFVGAVTQAFQVAVESAATVIEPVADVLLFAADTVNQALSVGQEIMFVAGAAATPEVVQHVAKANNRNFQVASAFSLTGFAENASGWADFTESYRSDSAAMASRAEIIRNSRDRFSKERDWDLLPVWFFSTPLTRHNVIRRGETRLIYVEPSETHSENGQAVTTPGHWEWKAKDSVSLQTRIWRILGTRRIEVPIGWSQAYANDNPGTTGSIEPCQPLEEPASIYDDGCPKWLGMNKRAEQLASRGAPGISGARSNIDLSHLYGGLRNFRDLKGFPEQDQDPRLELRVEVFTDNNAVETIDDASFHSAVHDDARPDPANLELAAIAKSELYFHRPEIRHLGDYVEYANGYNPFWDVRLKSLDARERLAAVFLRAEGVLTPELSSSVPSTVAEAPLAGNGPGRDVAGPSSAEEANPDRADGGLPSFDDFVNGTAELEIPDRHDGVFSLGVSDHFINAALSEPASISEVAGWINSDFQLATDVAGEIETLLPLFDTDALAEQLSERYRDEVEEVIESAAQELLSNALSGFGPDSLGGNMQTAFITLENQANNVISGLAEAENRIDDAINTLELETQQHRNELERIRSNVVDEFALAVEEVGNEIMAELLEIETHTDVLTNLLDPAFAGLDLLELESFPDELLLHIEDLGIDVTQELSQQTRDLLQDEINELVNQQTDVAGSALERQALRLVEIIDTETDLFSVPLDRAMQVIELMDEAEDPTDPLSITDEEEILE